jgi:hypothetical protein
MNPEWRTHTEQLNCKQVATDIVLNNLIQYMYYISAIKFKTSSEQFNERGPAPPGLPDEGLAVRNLPRGPIQLKKICCSAGFCCGCGQCLPMTKDLL